LSNEIKNQPGQCIHQRPLTSHCVQCYADNLRPRPMGDTDVMIEYLLTKVRLRDWHAVRDAAVDIEIMEAKL
jgi:hypothetical protein